MRPANLTPWAAGFLLFAWLTAAGPLQGAEESAPSTEAAAPRDADAADPPSNPTGPTPSAQRPSAEQPPGRPQSTPPKLKSFRPSEEIHVDKAVDFPADI